MAHITLNSDEPGIRGLFRFRPETAQPLNELVEVLLREPNTLTRGERELIASYVSSLNECKYCCSSHSAYAAAQLPEGMPLVRQVCTDVSNAPVSPKLRALLDIAAALSVSFFHRLEVANGERNHLGGDRTTLSLVGVKKGLASPVAEDPASFHPRL